MGYPWSVELALLDQKAPNLVRPTRNVWQLPITWSCFSTCLYTILKDQRADGEAVKRGGMVVDCSHNVLTLIIRPH